MGDISWQPPVQYYLKLLTRLTEGEWVGLLKVGGVAEDGWGCQVGGCGRVEHVRRDYLHGTYNRTY